MLLQALLHSLLDVLHSFGVGLVLGDLVGDVLGVQGEIFKLPEVNMLLQCGVDQIFQQIEIFRLRKTNNSPVRTKSQ